MRGGNKIYRKLCAFVFFYHFCLLSGNIRNETVIIYFSSSGSANTSFMSSVLPLIFQVFFFPRALIWKKARISRFARVPLSGGSLSSPMKSLVLILSDGIVAYLHEFWIDEVAGRFHKRTSDLLKYILSYELELSLINVIFLASFCNIKD